MRGEWTRRGLESVVVANLESNQPAIPPLIVLRVDCVNGRQSSCRVHVCTD